MGDTEILETYLNSGSKNTSETAIFSHGTKSLLTIVIGTNFLKKLYNNELSLFSDVAYKRSTEKRIFFCSRPSSHNLAKQIVITNRSSISFSVIVLP